MIFNEANKERLEKLFKEANGKCRERILTYDNVKHILEKIEETLDIPKKDMIGITAVIDPNAQNFPRAYGYVPYSIYCFATRKKTGWDIEKFGKYRTARAGHAAEIRLTKDAKIAILESKSHC